MTATPETVFAARLSYAMEARGMSSNRLAALIGAQAKTVLNWRSGHRMPKLATLPALCVALGVGAGWITGMSDAGGPHAGRRPRYGPRPDLPRLSRFR